MAQIEHRGSGDDVHGGVDKHEGEIDEESPVQHVAELLLADISELSGGPVTAIGLSAACRRLTVTAQIRHLRHQSFLFDRIPQVSRLSLLWIPLCRVYTGLPLQHGTDITPLTARGGGVGKPHSERDRIVTTFILTSRITGLICSATGRPVISALHLDGLPLGVAYWGCFERPPDALLRSISESGVCT